MMYKCPQCGNTAEQPGNCPTCNVPMVESPAAPQTEQPPAQPSSQ